MHLSFTSFILDSPPKESLLCPIFGFCLFSRTGTTGEHCREEDEGCAGDGGPDAAVAVVGAAGEDAGAVLLDVAGAGDVLAVVAPVARGAEALRPQLPLEDPSHLDAVVCLKQVKTIYSGYGGYATG